MNKKSLFFSSPFFMSMIFYPMVTLRQTLGEAIKNKNLDEIQQLLATMPPCIPRTDVESFDSDFDDDIFVQTVWITLFVLVIKHIHDPDTIRLFLSHPGVDVNCHNNWESPMRMAIAHYNMDVFKILLDDPRITLFYCDEESDGSEDDGFNNTLVLMIRYNKLEMMKYLVAARRFSHFWHRTSTTKNFEIALSTLDTFVDGANFHDNPLQAETYVGMYRLLRAMIENPWIARYNLRLKLGLPLAPDIFALVIFLCDDLLKLSVLEDERQGWGTAKEHHRFFNMMKKLPIELQMIVCNMADGSPRQSIPLRYREEAFKDLTQVCTEMEMRVVVAVKLKK